MTTIRCLLYRDEYDQIHVEYPESLQVSDDGRRAQDLIDRGLDVPIELFEAYLAAMEQWAEMEKRFKEWVSDTVDDLAGSVVFDQTRTWAQLGRLATCDHDAAIKLVRSVTAAPWGKRCDACGVYVSLRRRAVNPSTGEWEDLKPPHEVEVLEW